MKNISSLTQGKARSFNSERSNANKTEQARNSSRISVTATYNGKIIGGRK